MKDARRRARLLIRDNILWDNHACLPLRPNDHRFLRALYRHRKAGFDIVSINIGYGHQALDQHIRMLAHFRRWIECHSEHFMLVDTAADIMVARTSGRLGVCFDIEGASCLDDGDLGLISLFHRLGVRWMLLAYNAGNRAGAGCYDEVDQGLTRHGKAVLMEMRRVGIAVCCSHTGKQTALDVMASADNPVIISHSNVRAIHDHPRNVDDELIRACAATGGVIGINGLGPFLGSDAVVPMVFRHIDHIVQLTGPKHVGLGLDYVFDCHELEEQLAGMAAETPGFSPPPPGFPMMGPEQIADLTVLMINAGYSEEAIMDILGRNFLRIALEVWDGRA